MKNWIGLGLIFLLSLPSFGQGSISGTLKDVATQEALEFVSVAIYKEKDSTLLEGSITDKAGTYILRGLSPGSYFLAIRFLGYKTLRVTSIQLALGENKQMGTLFLESDLQELESVNVRGQRISSAFNPEKMSFTGASFEAARGGTATDVLKNLPGVSITSEGNLTIRGSSGFVVMINSRPIQGDPMLVLNQLPANSIEKVEWISSPSAQYDAEGKSGIVNITTVSGVRDGVFLQANVRGGLPAIEDYGNASAPQRYGGDFNLNYQKNKWDLALGGSYQRNDVAGKRIGEVFTQQGDTLTYFASDGERSIDEKIYSGRFTLSYLPNSSQTLSLGLYAGVRDRIRTADILYFDNHQKYPGGRSPGFSYFNANNQNRRGDFILGSLDYTKKNDNQSQLSTSFLYEYSMLGGPTLNRNLGFPNITTIYQEEYNTNDNPLQGIRWNFDYTSKQLPIGQILAGYQFRYLNHYGNFIYERKDKESGTYELIPEFSSEVNLNRIIHAAYVQWNKKVKKWSYASGIRFEYMNRDFQLQDKSNLIDSTYSYAYFRPFFSGNVSYSSSENLTWKLNFTQRVERETTFKMNPFPEREHSETLEQGDPTVLPEFINTAEIGIIKTWEANSLFVTAYYNRIKNLVNRVNTVYNDSILNRIYSNVGTGQSWGLEVGTDIFLSEKWKTYLGGTVYRYTIDGTFDQKLVNQATWVNSVNLNSTYTISPSFSSQFSFSYLSPRVTAQGEDSRFYQPSLSFKKSFLEGQLAVQILWQNIDLGLLQSNEQRITTQRLGEFYTSTNYIYEVDVVTFNISYTLNKGKNSSKFIKSEFGEKEF
jgi:hypothetical protein